MFLFSNYYFKIHKIGLHKRELPRCPDYVTEFNLVDGKTKAVSYPKKGYNCIEYCPDFDEVFTLMDGKTPAIPDTKNKYNCVILGPLM